MKHRRLFLACLAAAACLVSTASAAPLLLDLGDGLAFVRVKDVPGDLPTHDISRVQPRVLDLRFARGEAEGGVILEAWLKARAGAKAPIFILANGETASALLAAVKKFEPSDSVLTVGISTRGFRSDIAVTGNEEAERRAYDALENGGEKLGALLSENPDKIRNDEASLSRDRLAEASADAVADAAKKASAPPPLDATLQRAIHVHRAMRALKKI